MSTEKIKQLEKLVSSAQQYLDNLCSENRRLEQRILELEKEKKVMTIESDRAKDSLEKIKQLEGSQQKLEKDCSTARVKVKIALKKIEKMDFA
tara:strand:- start:278 stop:556 length:279 start_codon:yes stop_codon:yes gene_type:complete